MTPIHRQICTTSAERAERERIIMFCTALVVSLGWYTLMNYDSYGYRAREDALLGKIASLQYRVAHKPKPTRRGMIVANKDGSVTCWPVEHKEKTR